MSQALTSRLMDSKIAWAITGSMTLSCSCPASEAIVTTWSLPMTLKHTWLTTSGITGLTFAGMIEDPAAILGRLISLRPARGPDAKSRRSLQIFDSFTADRLMVACMDT